MANRYSECVSAMYEMAHYEAPLRESFALKACAYCGTHTRTDQKCESCGAPAAVAQVEPRRWYGR